MKVVLDSGDPNITLFSLTTESPFVNLAYMTIFTQHWSIVVSAPVLLGSCLLRLHDLVGDEVLRVSL